jgi:hypothetical protein
MFYLQSLCLEQAEGDTDMFDTILGIGATFDWISPLASVIGDLMNGPSHTFLIPYGSSPLSGREIAWMLGKRGVKSWGQMVVSGTLMVSVRLGQARWAEHLLDQAGVPIENPMPAAGRTRRAGGRRSQRGQAQRRRATKRKSDLGALADSINEVLNTRLF